MVINKVWLSKKTGTCKPLCKYLLTYELKCSIKPPLFFCDLLGCADSLIRAGNPDLIFVTLNEAFPRA
jgi:hypothetical protein